MEYAINRNGNPYAEAVRSYYASLDATDNPQGLSIASTRRDLRAAERRIEQDAIRELRQAMTPGNSRQAAYAAAKVASCELGIPYPGITIVSRAEAERKGAWAWANGGGEIYVRGDLCACRTAHAVAHECKHVWQFEQIRNGRWSIESYREREHEIPAENYAEGFKEAHFPKGCARCDLERAERLILPKPKKREVIYVQGIAVDAQTGRRLR